MLICDDDGGLLQELSSLLLDFFSEARLSPPELALYNEGETLLQSELLPGDPRADIAFLDVEMPGLSGIDVGQRLMERNPYLKIFIVTSYADYLDDAMRFHVFRYLSKPIDRERLFRNMRDALTQLSMDTRPIVIETGDGAVTRFADEIMMVEADGRLTLVHTVDNTYPSPRKISHWERALALPSFYMTHRSFLVNMKYVSRFDQSTIDLGSPSGRVCRAYMARRRYKDFKNAYLTYVEVVH
nr:LytTR family DNA-binding domain-containing protein [Acutalibacter muris]